MVSVIPAERGVAHGALERAERWQVLGGAPYHEAGAVAEATDPDRQRPDWPVGKPDQQLDREPGEPEAASQGP